MKPDEYRKHYFSGMSFWRWFFCIPVVIEEEWLIPEVDADVNFVRDKTTGKIKCNKEKRFIKIYPNDPLFSLTLSMVVLGISFAFPGILCLLPSLSFAPLDIQIVLAVAPSVMLIAGLLLLTQFTRLDPQDVGARQLVKEIVLFRNCLIFKPFSIIVVLPGDVEMKPEFMVNSLVKMRQNQPAGGPSHPHDFDITIIWRFDVWNLAGHLINLFFADLKRKKGEDENGPKKRVTEKVDGKVIALVSQFSDVALQQMSLDQLRDERGKMNELFTAEMKTLTKVYGVELLKAAIGQVRGAPMDLRNDATRREEERDSSIRKVAAESEERQKNAEARKKARIAESNAKLAAEKVVQANDKEILACIKLVLDQQLANQKIQSEADVQNLEFNIKALATNLQAALVHIIDKMGEDERKAWAGILPPLQTLVLTDASGVLKPLVDALAKKLGVPSIVTAT